MLRTLAINSNQIVLSFGVLIAFWSPKQSKIEESSLESLSKSRIQGVWDPAHTTRIGIPSGCRHFPPGCRVPLHPDAAAIPPGFRRHYIRLQPLFTRMYHIRNFDVGWKRRAFQLPRSHISGSAYSAYPESFAAFCTVPRCSPEASLYVRSTFWNILRYFCFRYLMSNSPNSPCNPPIIWFLSY